MHLNLDRFCSFLALVLILDLLVRIWSFSFLGQKLWISQGPILVFENRKCQFRPNCVEIHCGLIFHCKMLKIGGNLSQLLRKHRKKVETKKIKNADFSAEKLPKISKNGKNAVKIPFSKMAKIPSVTG